MNIDVILALNVSIYGFKLLLRNTF